MWEYTEVSGHVSNHMGKWGNFWENVDPFGNTWIHLGMSGNNQSRDTKN